MAATDIGLRLRTVRESRKLSQRQLAARTGVTNGQISLIEQNKVSPSVANLKKILDGIPMTLGQFFSDDETGQAKTFYRHSELAEIGTSGVHGPDVTDGKLSLLRVGGGSDSETLMMLHETYEPGADTGARLYSHIAEEAGIVIEGEIEVTVGEEQMVLRSGDAYSFDSRRPHRFRNRSAKRCVLVSACTPPTF